MSYTSKSVRRKLWYRENGICYLCNYPLNIDKVSVDHYLPRSKGGTNSLENLFPTHKECNIEKADMLYEEYLEYKKDPTKFISKRRMYKTEVFTDKETLQQVGKLNEWNRMPWYKKLTHKKPKIRKRKPEILFHEWQREGVARALQWFQHETQNDPETGSLATG